MGSLILFLKTAWKLKSSWSFGSFFFFAIFSKNFPISSNSCETLIFGLSTTIISLVSFSTTSSIISISSLKLISRTSIQPWPDQYSKFGNGGIEFFELFSSSMPISEIYLLFRNIMILKIFYCISKLCDEFK